MEGKTFFKKTGESLMGSVKKGWLIMLLSLVFAVLFWGYVMAGLNPTRQKTVGGIPISITGTQDLLSRRLIVVDWESKTATAVISAEITKHASINAGRVDCVVSVNTITEPGTYTLNVNTTVQSNLGKTEFVNPATVKIEVDNLIKKVIPITLRTTGELPEGYGILDSSLSQGTYTLEGAARYLEPVVRAEAVVDISGKNENISGNVSLNFYNSEDEMIEVQTADKQTPTVIANVKISAFVELPVHVNALSPDEEIYDTIITPSATSVTVWGDRETLGILQQVETEFITITPELQSKTLPVTLIAPANTTLKVTQIKVTIQVSEHIYELNFDMQVDLKGLSRSLTADNFAGNFIVHVKGTKAQIDGLEAEDLTAYIDVSGLEAGNHELIIVLEVPKQYKDLEFTTVPDLLPVTLRAK